MHTHIREHKLKTNFFFLKLQTQNLNNSDANEPNTEKKKLQT